MKKILALVLALTLVLMVGASFAAPTVISTGSITVQKAQIGATYTAIKVLDAVVSEEGITYTGTIPTELDGIVGVTTITVGTGTDAKQYQAIGKLDGVTTDAYVAALRLYANNHKTSGTSKDATGNSVTFSNLATGFYVIISSVHKAGESDETNNVMACSTFDPDANPHTADGTVFEKNTTTVEITKTAEDSYTIGDTVEYTAKMVGANYLPDPVTGDLEVVTKYKVSDTLPEFLKDARVTKIKIGDTEYTGSTGAQGLTEDNFPGITTFGTAKTFDIPWATETTPNSHKWNSLYPNGTIVLITYEAELTDIVKVDGTDGNKNIITVLPYTDDGDGPDPYEDDWSDDHKIFTYAAALKKVDGSDTSKTLAGAKFKVKGLTVKETIDGTVGNYTVVKYDPSASADYGTEMTVDDNGMLYIVGLEDGLELTAKETVAPATYNLLLDEFKLSPVKVGEKIWAEGGHRWFDPEGNLVKETSYVMGDPEADVVINLDKVEPYAIKVINNAGTELPHTGGIGTTIFYILGGLLVIGAAVILVARRKAQD